MYPTRPCWSRGRLGKLRIFISGWNSYGCIIREHRAAAHPEHCRFRCRNRRIRSIHHDAAVHVEHFTRDETRERRGEETRGVRELFGLAEPRERDLREQLAALRVV